MASGDKKSPQLSKIKVKVGNSTVTASDSDASVETNSLSAESATEQNNVPQTEKRRKKNRRGSEWEIMEGLKDGQRFDNKPNPFNGFLHKKRKWPLKGWHKVGDNRDFLNFHRIIFAPQLLHNACRVPWIKIFGEVTALLIIYLYHSVEKIVKLVQQYLTVIANLRSIIEF